MHISAKTDYAMRAVLVLASARSGSVVTADAIATRQHLPRKFLDAILADLRRARIIDSQRGTDGGYRLARPASQIVVADVMRAVDGPLAEVRGLRPETLEYVDAAQHLQEVWVAVRAGLRAVLERTSVADVAAGELPVAVRAMVHDLDGWQPR